MTPLLPSPRRVLSGFTGAVLIAVGLHLRLDGVIFVPEIWAVGYMAAGAGLVWLAARPDLGPHARATIAVVASTALVARSLALIVVLVRFPTLGGPSTLIGALVWPLVAGYIVTLLAYWNHLAHIVRPPGGGPGGDRDRPA